MSNSKVDMSWLLIDSGVAQYTRRMKFKGDCGSLALWLLKHGYVATKTRHPRSEIGPFPLF